MLGMMMGTFYGIYIQRINDLTVSLQSLTVTDELTSCYNRRFLYQKIEEEIKRASRYSSTFSLIMLDIDHFKTYNDRNGHIKGDKLLKMFSKLLRNIVRAPDIVARYGGDEFCIILYEANKKQAYNFCRRILRNVTEYNFPDTDVLPGGVLTTSIGVAEFSKEMKNFNDLIRKADNALYVSKNNGRNMISYFEALQGRVRNFA
jgi:diguanylate cyclase (GGDEF)-like protein